MNEKNQSLREFGATGFQWTSIGLGTWNTERHRVDSIAALKAGVEAGANHIDTAEMYGDGTAEELVGEAIQGQRKKLFVVSKVLASNATYDGTLAACERSLKRLRTDYLDVYLLHWRERGTNLSETFRAFEKLKFDGKIRAWGVSNFDVADLNEAIELVGDEKIACNQVRYHLRERTVESAVLPWCKAHGVTVVAYSPLGQGRLPTHPVLDEIARAHGATPPQVALAFLTRDTSVLAIPKSSNEHRVRENVNAMRLTLTDAEIRKLEVAFPLQTTSNLRTR